MTKAKGTGRHQIRGGYRPLFFGLGSGRVLDLRARVGSGLKVRVRVGPAFFGFQASTLKLVHFLSFNAFLLPKKISLVQKSD